MWPGSGDEDESTLLVPILLVPLVEGPGFLLQIEASRHHHSRRRQNHHPRPGFNAVDS